MSSLDSRAPSGPADVADEEALLARLRAGDDAAYEAVVREYSPRMLAVARRMMGNEHDARDAVQDAFLSAFKAIDSFAGDAKLSTWLHRIVVNACLMKLRSARRHPTKQIDDLLPKFADNGHRIPPARNWTQTPADALQREETAHAVREAIEQLPETHRTVLLLRDIEELDTAETAELLGINAGAVKTRLHRARLALRELLADNFADQGGVL